ncbi:hypothetical protein AArcMg_0669 [Natrarchaeobaculum sulfurireducens]|uniref:Transcription factor TFIIB cyclin-like domain-containing protein n=2 Tax=Natrarchaeobaculum sulfurireducens TaxID=2044521 RepID=A0A346PME6_9EURY|nr:hypothetical protein AArcMg_0669 [Natrarchaeobaculum sulfurireducens]
MMAEKRTIAELTGEHTLPIPAEKYLDRFTDILDVEDTVAGLARSYLEALAEARQGSSPSALAAGALWAAANTGDGETSQAAICEVSHRSDIQIRKIANTALEEHDA